ncbi:hypothetical protein GOODEAATRI_020712 [Goodea atripinnis]|uniref:Uncharacterized protein n=1 Tax=Goodea atripinnis TaxID=208336 RepID=A0ABV0NWB1_9TELE
MNCLAEGSQMAGTVSTQVKSEARNFFCPVLELIVLRASSLRNLNDSEKTFSAFIDPPLAALISRLLVQRNSAQTVSTAHPVPLVARGAIRLIQVLRRFAFPHQIPFPQRLFAAHAAKKACAFCRLGTVALCSRHRGTTVTLKAHANRRNTCHLKRYLVSAPSIFRYGPHKQPGHPDLTNPTSV